MQLATFDTAADCEQAALAWLNAKANDPKQQQCVSAFARKAKCIASDDPRLKGD